MAYSLLYVSKTLLEHPQAEAEVAQIVASSASRNARLGVTGALVSTSTYFAQLLEGPRSAVGELMQSINADPRHMRVRIIRTAEEERRFAEWSMVYTGYASFVDRHIAPFFCALAARRCGASGTAAGLADGGVCTPAGGLMAPLRVCYARGARARVCGPPGAFRSAVVACFFCFFAVGLPHD